MIVKKDRWPVVWGGIVGLVVLALVGVGCRSSSSGKKREGGKPGDGGAQRAVPPAPSAKRTSAKRATSATQESPPEGRPRQAPPSWLIDRPIRFGPKRKALTLKYIRIHYDPKATNIKIVPRMVVVHWTGTPSLERSWAIFNPIQITSRRPYIRRHGLVNVSVHFVVGRDGTTYRLMPETWMGRHVIGLNHLSLGIENAGSGRHPLTAKQLEANLRLIRYLAQKYPIRYLIGHLEYQRFRGSPLYIERVKGYRTRKADPGHRFMRLLRKRLADLKLRQRP